MTKIAASRSCAPLSKSQRTIIIPLKKRHRISHRMASLEVTLDPKAVYKSWTMSIFKMMKMS